MAKPTLVPETMKLYAPFCPQGRLFQKHSEWPGDVWTADPDGKDDKDAGIAELAQEVATLQDEVERLNKLVAIKDRSLADLGGERDRAVADMEAQKQALLDAKQCAADLEARAQTLTKERDQARANAQTLSRKLAETDA